MIISHSKKFIFIHNYKVAGTSIRQVLSKYGNLTFLKSSLWDKLMQLTFQYPWVFASDFPTHVRAKEIRNKIPLKLYDSYFKFGFVRDPWDWQVSLYHYTLVKKDHHQYQLVSEMKDFKEYIHWRVNNDVHLQKEFFYDEDGNCIVDFIGRLENLETDFESILGKIDASEELPHVNKRKERYHYLTFYDQESIDLVNNAFSEDILTFGYKKPNLKDVNLLR